MTFQRGSMMAPVPSYTDASLPHNIPNEDIMGSSIQGIAYITVSNHEKYHL